MLKQRYRTRSRRLYACLKYPHSPSLFQIYQEVVHSVARRSLQSLLILVVDTHPAERPRGPFSEIDLAQLAPFQMYEIEEIFKVKMDPPPSVKLMLQWVPMTFEKPIKLILPSARLHFHNSTVAPGDVLRGEFILCNDIPRPCTGVTLHLRCRQSADYQEIKEIKRHAAQSKHKRPCFNSHIPFSFLFLNQAQRKPSIQICSTYGFGRARARESLSYSLA